MRWQEFIDGYDRKARLIPTVIALTPLFCTVYYFFPGPLDKPLQLAGSSLLSFFGLLGLDVLQGPRRTVCQAILGRTKRSSIRSAWSDARSIPKRKAKDSNPTCCPAQVRYQAYVVRGGMRIFRRVHVWLRMNLTLLALWVPFAWLILPRMLMLSAEAYAGRAWITFLSLAEEISKKPSSSVGLQTDHRCVSSE
jgi:hypothetical protein